MLKDFLKKLTENISTKYLFQTSVLCSFVLPSFFPVLDGTVMTPAVSLLIGSTIIAANALLPVPKSLPNLSLLENQDFSCILNKVSNSHDMPVPDKVYLISPKADKNQYQLSAGTNSGLSYIAISPKMLKFSKKQLKALLSHELGHIAHNDSAIINKIERLFGFQFLANMWMMLLSNSIVPLGFLSISFVIIQKIKKEMEYQADEFAVFHNHATKGKDLIKALKKLKLCYLNAAKPNSDDVDYDAYQDNLLTTFMSAFEGHPTVTNRLVNLKEKEQKRKISFCLS